jgi:hypothetical protein
VLVEIFEGKTGTKHPLLGSGVWCSSCECGLWGRTGCGASGGAGWEIAAARKKLARPGRKCWSKLIGGKTGTKRTLLGSDVWCSSWECGLLAREAHWLWCEWWSLLGEGSSSHEAGTSWKEVLVEVVRREDGHRTHTAWQWCVVLVMRVWPLGERGALIVVRVVELVG